MATAKEAGAHLDLSDRSVRDLQSRGVLPPSEGRGALDLDACRVAYIRHLREQAAGRKGDGGKLNLADERARLAAEQADAIEMKNAMARGELVSASAISSAVIGAIELAKARLMRVPAIVAKTNADLRGRIETALRDAMEDLSATRVEALTDEGTDGGDDPSDEPEG